MGIKYLESNPNIRKFFNLFETTGWNKEYGFTEADLEQSIGKSWYSVSAYEEDNLCGYGRAISDGIHHALICEMIVDPEYQGRGIGKELLKMLVNKCKASKIRDIQLFCATGKKGFYEKNGFVVRNEQAPGMEIGTYI